MDKQFGWTYSDIVKDHFMNPRNVLHDEDSFDDDGKGIVGNMRCGDQMMITIKVEDGKITDCRWKTYGCASAIASTSMLSEAVKGMQLEDAYHLKPEDIAGRLGGLPENKIHCSVLGDKALRAAIEDYYKRNHLENKLEKENARIVCECMNVTDKDIEKAVKEGVKNYEDLQKRTKIGTSCGKCKDDTLKLLDEYLHLYG
ncbi:MAG: iron-sulfur cluster assembly scaffold protein [Spirochaetota bacterium]